MIVSHSFPASLFYGFNKRKGKFRRKMSFSYVDSANSFLREDLPNLLYEKFEKITLDDNIQLTNQ
jgi:hypothetical protein